MNWGTMGWGYWDYPWVLGVDRWKSLDARRMTNVCNRSVRGCASHAASRRPSVQLAVAALGVRRWAKNHTDDLQAAFFNGVGFESWENVWGIWNGIVPRDAQAIKRTAALLRFISGVPLPSTVGVNRNLTQSPFWVPYVPTEAGNFVFASLWPSAAVTFSQSNPLVPQITGTAAWTLVNRGDVDISGPQLSLVIADQDLVFFDLVRKTDCWVYLCMCVSGCVYWPHSSTCVVLQYHGVQLTPATDGKGVSTLSFTVEGSGFGAVLAVSKADAARLHVEEFLATMKVCVFCTQLLLRLRLCC